MDLQLSSLRVTVTVTAFLITVKGDVGMCLPVVTVWKAKIVTLTSNVTTTFVRPPLANLALKPAIVNPVLVVQQLVFASTQTAMHAETVLSVHQIYAASTVSAKATAIQAKLVLAAHNA